VKIRNFTHKGLLPLYIHDDFKGVPPDTVDKLRKMFAMLDSLSHADELRAITTWKVHTLSGDRKRTWSLSVTRNRRLTFRMGIAGLTVTAAAQALQVSRRALSSLLNSKAGLTGEMALRIEKAFGIKMDTLMRMQSAYDIAQTRKREKEIRVKRIHIPAETHV
jgi:addiction module HigA family antidote